ncbi:MAG TPA: FAD binding domain-containing protein [Burkholderiales bacterium]|nr:FAD binding domain-containing protein [Burkholderiales bacterium]
MKPAAFDYVRADSVDEATALLREHGDDARVLAGGQSLMPLLNMRLASPAVLVDISRLSTLDYARVERGALCVGAACTQSKVEGRPGLAREVPLLALAFPHISHFQVRNRGTVCGSVAHADPSAELPLVLTALGGEIALRSTRGTRTVAAQDFFHGALTTACADDELVEEVRFPMHLPGLGYGFAEMAQRHGDFAIVACAAVTGVDEIRFAVGGAADRPRAVRWPRLAGADLDAALNDFAWEIEARSDPHGSAKFRRHLVRHLGRRAVEEACA